MQGVAFKECYSHYSHSSLMQSHTLAIPGTIPRRMVTKRTAGSHKRFEAHGELLSEHHSYATQKTSRKATVEFCRYGPRSNARQRIRIAEYFLLRKRLLTLFFVILIDPRTTKRQNVCVILLISPTIIASTSSSFQQRFRDIVL